MGRMTREEWELLREETLAEIAGLREEMEAKLAACEARLLAKLEEAKKSIVAGDEPTKEEDAPLAAEEQQEGDEATAPGESAASSAGLDALIGILDASDEGNGGEEEEEKECSQEALSSPSDTPSEAEAPTTGEDQSPGEEAPHAVPGGEEQAGSGTDDDDMPQLEEATESPPPTPPVASEKREETQLTPNVVVSRSQSVQPVLLRPKPPARPPRRPKEGERERPMSMWIAGSGTSQQHSAPQLQRNNEGREKRRSSAFSLAREREAASGAKGDGGQGGLSPLRHIRSNLLTAGRTQSIPNLPVAAQKQKQQLAVQSSAADVEEALKVVAAAVFKGLMEVESSLEAQPPKKLKGFVNGRALASFLVRLLKLRSRNDSLKLLNAVAARYIMDATCQADSTPIIMDEAAEWFGFKIPVFMFPEKLAEQASRAVETVLGHNKFGPCDISRIVPDVAERSAAVEWPPVELLRGPVETSGEKAKKWHKRFAVLSSLSLKLFRSSDMNELIGEHAVKSLASLVFTPAKNGGRGDRPKAAQFTLCFVVGDNRTAFSMKVPSDSPYTTDEWILSIDGAQAFNCALLSLLDATALSQRSRMDLLSMPAAGADEITHGRDTWTIDLTTGMVRCTTAELGDITYVFDGSFFYPPADANQLHGMGRWDGLNLSWFETASFDHRNAVRASPVRGLFVDADPVLRYHFDRAQHLFIPAASQAKICKKEDSSEEEAADGGGSWCWTGEDLARKDGTGTAWAIEGSCPNVVVMLLQMLWDHATQDLSMPRGQLIIPPATTPATTPTAVSAEEESSSAVSTPEREDSPEPEIEQDATKDESPPSEEVTEAVELRPVPNESSSIIASPYSSMNSQQSRSKTSTKVKRSRRRSVKLTKAKLTHSGESPKPGDSALSLPETVDEQRTEEAT